MAEGSGCVGSNELMFGVKNFRFQIEDFRLGGTVTNFAMTRNQGKSEI
jgi:hypothetical protein